MTDDAKPVLDQINLVVSDMDASIDFYRRLGLDVPDGGSHDGIRHVEIEMAGGVHLALDNETLAQVYNAEWRRPGGGERALIGFRCRLGHWSTTSTPTSPRTPIGGCRFRSTRSGARGTRSSPTPTATRSGS